MNTGFRKAVTRVLGGISLMVCIPAVALTCDVDGSGEINSVDIGLIMQALNRAAAPGDPRDANGNGTINILDARACTLRCTRAHCALPSALVANPDSYSTAEGATLTVPAPGVLGNDAPASGLTAALVTGPASGVLSFAGDGSFVYIPASNVNGRVTFTYRATDGQSNSDTATVTIQVGVVDDRPIANDDSYPTALQDTTFGVPAPGVLANDTDVDGPVLHAVLVTGPASGTLSLNADGSFTYVPDFNFTGQVTFEYKANDSILDSPGATVTITVNAPVCAPGSGPTLHGSGRVSGNEVWTAAESPHIVTADTTVTGTLTIEPCAEVLIDPGLTIGVSGQLIAEGTANQRIHIGPHTPGMPFAQLRGNAGTLRFAYATIEGGGDPLNTIPSVAGMIRLQGIDQTQPTQGLLHVDHVIVKGSASNGIVLQDGAGFTQNSTALTVIGSTLAPVNMWSRAVGTLPLGHYTGNGVDEIVLLANGGNESIAESTTMHNRGVPYRVGIDISAGSLRIGPLPGHNALVTLTIAPGVTLRFKKAGVMWVSFGTSDDPALGALTAAGTATMPIVFTSAETAPAAGDWLGIYYGNVPSAANRLDFTRVEYAGAFSQFGGGACSSPPATPPNDAAVRIFGPPPGQFVTNSTIFASGRHGIDRGWVADNFTDFLSSNTFQSVPFCKQTYPRDSHGGCPPPNMVPCP